jgi:hypothetical protein
MKLKSGASFNLLVVNKYDKPSDYQGEREIEFFEKRPTVWDDTEILQGELIPMERDLIYSRLNVL